MFEQKDFVAYFTEIQMMEKNMRDIFEEALNLISDTEVRRIFEGLAKSEAEHELLVDELRRLAIKKSVKDER